MAYKAMRRAVMEPKHDAELRETAGKVYRAIGLELPEERKENTMQPRAHGGSELVSTFVPTPKGPKLNVVHGPNAVDNSMMQLPREVIGLPIVGAGAWARTRAEMPASPDVDMDIDKEFEEVDTKPYFYPRRVKKRGGICKKAARRAKNPNALRKRKRDIAETVRAKAA